MELTSVPVPNPAVILRKLDEREAVLVNLDTAASLALNTTSILVWESLDGRRCARDVVAAVRGHFRDVPDTVDDDVIALLSLFAEGGFVGFEVSVAS